jgi:hypothetical protein
LCKMNRHESMTIHCEKKCHECSHNHKKIQSSHSWCSAMNSWSWVMKIEMITEEFHHKRSCKRCETSQWFDGSLWSGVLDGWMRYVCYLLAKNSHIYQEWIGRKWVWSRSRDAHVPWSSIGFDSPVLQRVKQMFLFCFIFLFALAGHTWLRTPYCMCYFVDSISESSIPNTVISIQPHLKDQDVRGCGSCCSLSSRTNL